MYAIISNFSSSKLTTLWYATDPFLKYKKRQHIPVSQGTKAQKWAAI